MGKAFPLGTIAGIRVQVHWTFSLLLAWVVLTALLAGEGLIAALSNTFFILVLFSCVVLHEFGHALAARRFGISTRDITLLPIGGVARLEQMPRKPWQEFVVAVAGPAVNVVIATTLFVVLAPQQGVSQLFSIPTGDESFLQRVMFVNLVLVVFNMVPAFPMDGGRVLRSFLASFMDYVAAIRVAAMVGQVCAIGFGLLGFVNPMLLLLAAFVFFAATAESRQVEMLARLRGWRVRDAMTRDFRVVSAKTPIAACAMELLNSPQRHFPVTDDGRYFGMLRQSDLLQAIRSGNAEKIGDIAKTDVAMLTEADPLASVLELSAASHGARDSAWRVNRSGRRSVRDGHCRCKIAAQCAIRCPGSVDSKPYVACFSLVHVRRMPDVRGVLDAERDRRSAATGKTSCTLAKTVTVWQRHDLTSGQKCHPRRANGSGVTCALFS